MHRVESVLPNTLQTPYPCRSRCYAPRHVGWVRLILCPLPHRHGVQYRRVKGCSDPFLLATATALAGIAPLDGGRGRTGPGLAHGNKPKCGRLRRCSGARGRGGSQREGQKEPAAPPAPYPPWGCRVGLISWRPSIWPPPMVTGPKGQLGSIPLEGMGGGGGCRPPGHLSCPPLDVGPHHPALPRDFGFGIGRGPPRCPFCLAPRLGQPISAGGSGGARPAARCGRPQRARAHAARAARALVARQPLLPPPPPPVLEGVRGSSGYSAAWPV
jgi:hypothetical protein